MIQEIKDIDIQENGNQPLSTEVLKVLLVEKKKTNRWLVLLLHKDESIVSKWCSNSLQPNLITLIAIADNIKVGIRELICYSLQKTV